ncbi:uncharacterized protein [Chanodichthys erythropterus]|uniref:uncharacterized protein isoform X2 n=1 Tax=Chanodichthys erythropterus TaxID=933992 RepID=UPI00351E71C0
MELELCTCPVGHSGAPCKHQAAIVQNYNITSINFLPTTAEMRAELLKITKDLHQLGPSSLSSAQLHQTSPTLEDSYSKQHCVPGNSEEASIPHSPVRRMLGLLSELAENSDYSDAITTMAKQLEKMQHNPTQLISAFYCFGKGMSVSKRAAALRRAARRPGPIIGCQPTAVARRTNKTGSRRRLTAGRPRKSSSGPEHDYSRYTGKGGKRAVRVRHKLSESVAMNYSHQT